MELEPDRQKTIDWRRRHLEWMLPRIIGGDAEKEQFVAMWFSSLAQAEYEGGIESAKLLEMIDGSISTPAGAGFFAERVRELAEMNLKSSDWSEFRS